jgi:hypothetical protein
MTAPMVAAAKHWLSQVDRFSRLVLERPLRPYQLEAAQAILDSVLHGRGRTFAVMMSRQAGKNELSAHLEAYLLNLYQRRGGQIVKASPTFKPQTVNSILRLADRLDNPWNRGRVRRREGYMVELGRARALFFSAGPGAHVVGATADLLLECDEAQDVGTEKWFKEFVPMAASTHATTVLWGTAWTSQTLLAQTIAHLRRQEGDDGIRRVFAYPAEVVADQAPAYGAHVADQVARLGRNHPLIKTQYYLEEVDAQGGLFGPLRRALMRGDHPRRTEPEPGRRYALLIDVAGEDEAEGSAQERMGLSNPRRDATALTVVEVEPRPGELPLYRTVDRRLWLGVRHTTLHDQIRALAHHWRAAWVVVDATGVGAGLASFLAKALPDRVRPVTFSARVKSDLGWAFVGLVETGRYREYAADASSGDDASGDDPETRQFWYEVEACQYEVRPGPGHPLRWGVWEAPGYDGRIARGHDDLLVSAALVATLDALPWVQTGPAAWIPRPDVLDEIDGGDW